MSSICLKYNKKLISFLFIFNLCIWSVLGSKLENPDWKMWIDTGISDESSLNNKRITAKSVFIVPKIPKCPEGYKLDFNDTCIKIKLASINHTNQWKFLLDKLNSMFANPNQQPNSQKLENSGNVQHNEQPFKLNIPINNVNNKQKIDINDNVTTTIQTTITIPTTTEETTIDHHEITTRKTIDNIQNTNTLNQSTTIIYQPTIIEDFQSTKPTILSKETTATTISSATISQTLFNKINNKKIIDETLTTPYLQTNMNNLTNLIKNTDKQNEKQETNIKLNNKLNKTEEQYNKIKMELNNNENESTPETSSISTIKDDISTYTILNDKTIPIYTTNEDIIPNYITNHPTTNEPNIKSTNQDIFTNIDILNINNESTVLPINKLTTNTLPQQPTTTTYPIYFDLLNNINLNKNDKFNNTIQTTTEETPFLIIVTESNNINNNSHNVNKQENNNNNNNTNVDYILISNSNSNSSLINNNSKKNNSNINYNKDIIHMLNDQNVNKQYQINQEQENNQDELINLNIKKEQEQNHKYIVDKIVNKICKETTGNLLCNNNIKINENHNINIEIDNENENEGDDDIVIPYFESIKTIRNNIDNYNNTNSNNKSDSKIIQILTNSNNNKQLEDNNKNDSLINLLNNDDNYESLKMSSILPPSSSSKHKNSSKKDKNKDSNIEDIQITPDTSTIESITKNNLLNIIKEPNLNEQYTTPTSSQILNKKIIQTTIKPILTTTKRIFVNNNKPNNIMYNLQQEFTSNYNNEQETQQELQQTQLDQLQNQQQQQYYQNQHDFIQSNPHLNEYYNFNFNQQNNQYTPPSSFVRFPKDQNQQQPQQQQQQQQQQQYIQKHPNSKFSSEFQNFDTNINRGGAPPPPQSSASASSSNSFIRFPSISRTPASTYNSNSRWPPTNVRWQAQQQLNDNNNERQYDNSWNSRWPPSPQSSSQQYYNNNQNSRYIHNLPITNYKLLQI